MNEALDKLHPQLFELLVCPQARLPLKWDKENNELISETAKCAYPIRDGIPIMLVSEARKIDIE
ncbi:MAG: Trm112 family protein [Alphaproteobacteria bacterium]|nr:Trm112 family protein [Alphaproteobacteria bacterium]